ncbi:MAG TPA: hypothetical protein PK907_08810 [Candidatus Sabulitectum sp.]|nr:hypothetical protein [Candidatus Sabulitectum sp.]
MRFSSVFILLVPVSFLFAAQIDVYCQSQLGEVHPFVFGSGDEITEEFSPLAEVSPMIGLTGVPMLRMGGIGNEYYDWEGNDYGGVMYLDVLEGMIIEIALSTSLDDFLQMCEENGIEPVLSVNFQINDPSKASRMVEYCNGGVDTPMGQIRAQRGHPEPYDVVYWQIGNEPDISGMVIPVGEYELTLFRHFGIPFDSWSPVDSVYATSSSFAALADEYADSMRAASPFSISIATMSLSGDMGWLSETVQYCGENTDWVDLHYYPAGTWEQTPPDTSDYITWLASLDSGPNAFDQWYQAMVDSMEVFSGGADIPVCVMEYNAIVMNPDLVWWNYVDGLFVADCLGHLAENGCTMGGVYSIIEGSPEDPNTSFGMIRGDTLSMRATAWVMKLLQEKMTGTMVLSTSDALGGGYGLDVHSSLRSDGKLCIVVVNKHLTQDFNTEVVLHGFTSSGYSEVWSIENDAPMEAPYNGTTGIQFRGNLWGSGSSFSRVFPAASVSVLLVHPEGSGTPPVVPGAGLAVAPVPVCGSSRVLVTLAEPAFVRLQVFDLAGRAVHELCSEFFPAGETSVDLDAGELPGGVYAVAGDIGDSSVSVRFAVI